MNTINGKVWKFGDHVDTDQIIPAERLTSQNNDKLGTFLFEKVRPGFPEMVSKGDMIVAGKNFGCGSSREHAPRSLMQAGIVCVVAESFARIFYRNSINIGLILVECKIEADEGDILSVDVDNGKIINETSKKSWSFPEYPPYIKELIASGGLMARLKGGK
ncbi:LeuD/DmdB family oxidoreductase small subunit [Candidatus Methanomassiliicoccus intestinalis]|jgi:3-isopropylmalate dehydratase small subunit|uniref:3-isopropylmalate dehydratase small subunit n=2 Tax=Candidatus Methanomassiliicoccus intestinalis TaxID=1406512 RepID=A0A8J8TEJ4_9ARCH|nr:MAG: 3-isopropylmalate dehydratase [Candidatus Methanomassiliicoccus intestinalis]